jgi:hypothetical protein
VRRIERAETIRVTLRTCAAGVWFAPAAILLGSLVAARDCWLALVLVVSVTRVLYSQWRMTAETAACTSPGAVRRKKAVALWFGRIADRVSAARFLAGYGSGCGAAIGLGHRRPIGRKSAAAAFYALAAALLTAYGISAGVWTGHRQPVLPRAIMARGGDAAADGVSSP